MCLSEAWTPGGPLENLLLCINKHLRAVATAGGEPLSDSTVMLLKLSARELTSVTPIASAIGVIVPMQIVPGQIFVPIFCMVTRNTFVS